MTPLEELKAVRAMAFPRAITFVHAAWKPVDNTTTRLGTATTFGEAFDLIDDMDCVSLRIYVVGEDRLCVSARR